MTPYEKKLFRNLIAYFGRRLSSFPPSFQKNIPLF